MMLPVILFPIVLTSMPKFEVVVPRVAIVLFSIVLLSEKPPSASTMPLFEDVPNVVMTLATSVLFLLADSNRMPLLVPALPAPIIVLFRMVIFSAAERRMPRFPVVPFARMVLFATKIPPTVTRLIPIFPFVCPSARIVLFAIVPFTLSWTKTPLRGEMSVAFSSLSAINTPCD